MAGTIKNVVFDMGNVLMRFDGLQLAQADMVTPEDAALLRDALFGAPIWVLLDSGTVTHEMVERVAAHLPARLRPNLHECMAHWAERSLLIEGTNDLVVRLRKQSTASACCPTPRRMSTSSSRTCGCAVSGRTRDIGSRVAYEA